MTKQKTAEGFLVGNLIFYAFDGGASLQSRQLQAGVTIYNDAARGDHQREEKGVFARLDQSVKPRRGNAEAELGITGMRPQVSHLLGHDPRHTPSRRYEASAGG